MPLTHFALDEFVSQDLSKLTACRLETLADEFPGRRSWFAGFVLRRVFHNHVSNEKAALAFVVLRRADAAIDEWELACEAAKEDVRAPSAYFKLLRHSENCISALWQGLEFSRRALGTELFKMGDGSAYERLNWIYNVARHFDPQALPAGDLHRVWITNDGVHTREHMVYFGEVREEIKFLGGVVEKFAGEVPENG